MNDLEKIDRIKKERMIANYLDFMHWALVIAPFILFVLYVTGI